MSEKIYTQKELDEHLNNATQQANDMIDHLHIENRSLQEQLNFFAIRVEVGDEIGISLKCENQTLQDRLNSLERRRELGRQGAENLVAQIGGLQNIVTDLLTAAEPIREYFTDGFASDNNTKLLDEEKIPVELPIKIWHTLSIIVDRVKRRESDGGYIPFLPWKNS